jgi:transcriptional regulator with XRE-family HTH domain/tetratricopeptide (TPR) repeat protein
LPILESSIGKRRRYGIFVAATETFGTILRQLRIAAGLTQERLAERSGISATGVAALESGRRKSPRLNTVGLLCDALKLNDDQRAVLIVAATHNDTVVDEASIAAEGVAKTAPESIRTRDRSFVGRASELQTLQDAWGRKVKVALLLGEAGVGKSTLAEEFATDLAARDVSVLRGRSTPEQLGVYEAFIDPVRSALGRFDSKIPTRFRDLGRLVPGLFESGADLLVPSRSDPAVERRLLFETVSALFTSMGPTLLLLDDLHWADPGTLALLSFLMSQPDLSELMTVGTIRSTEVTPSTNAALAELRRHCTVERIQLTGLTKPHLAHMVSTLAGAEVSEALIEAVTKATNGNPLYIKELTEHLLHGGFDAARESPTVPDGIRHTIELRVAGLSKEAQALLRGGAVLGQSFDVVVAGQLVELVEDGLLGAFEDALLSGLLVEQSASTAVFSHGLVATTVYAGTSQLRRVGLHRSAAIALADRDPATSAEIVNVARHWAFVAQADPLARNTAAEWSVRAGDAAASSTAIDEAIACYERAALLWHEPTSAHADTLVRLGSAMTSIGRRSDGNEHLQRALHLADLADDASVFARAALGLAASVRYGFSDPQRILELEAAIAKLGPADTVLRPALLATLRRQLGFVNTPEADERRIAAAGHVADAVSAPDVSDELLISLGSLRDSLVVDDPIPLGELARKIIKVASARQDLPVLSTGWYRQAWSALELGEAEMFHQAVAEYRRIAEHLRRPYELAISSNMIAAVAQIEGRYDDAEAAGQEALSHAALIEDGNFGWVYFANSGLRAVDTGSVVSTFELMSAVRVDFAGLATFEAALAAIAAAAGDHAFANQLIGEQVGEHGENLARDWSYLSAERLPVVGMLAWGCAMSGNVDRAPFLLDRLSHLWALGVRVVRIAPVGAWIGPIDHHMGALHRVLGDFDAAQIHLERALTVEGQMNGRPYQVRTLLELANLTDARGGPVARTAEFRGKAEDLALKLGLESLL